MTRELSQTTQVIFEIDTWQQHILYYNIVNGFLSLTFLILY